MKEFLKTLREAAERRPLPFVVTGAGLLVVALFAFLLWPRQRGQELVIVNGIEYRLLSYGSVQPQLDQDQVLEAYVITVAYEDPLRGPTRGTILVPKSGIRRDRNLPTNTVVWDEPIALEGKVYAAARWNPGYSVPANDSPAVIPEPPLTRPTQ